MLEVCENDVLHRAVKMVVLAQAFLPSCPFFRYKVILVRNMSVRGNLRLFPKKVDFFGLPLVEIDRSSINCHLWKQLCKPKIYFQTNENVFLSNPHVKNRYQFCDGLRRSNWESSPSHDIWNRKRKLPHAEGWGDDGRVVYSYGWGCVKKGCVNTGGGGNTWPW